MYHIPTRLGDTMAAARPSFVWYNPISGLSPHHADARLLAVWDPQGEHLSCFSRLWDLGVLDDGVCFTSIGRAKSFQQVAIGQKECPYKPHRLPLKPFPHLEVRQGWPKGEPCFGSVGGTIRPSPKRRGGSGVIGHLLSFGGYFSCWTCLLLLTIVAFALCPEDGVPRKTTWGIKDLNHLGMDETRTPYDPHSLHMFFIVLTVFGLFHHPRFLDVFASQGYKRLLSKSHVPKAKAARGSGCMSCQLVWSVLRFLLLKNSFYTWFVDFQYI